MAAAPALLAVSSPAEREQVHEGIAREIGYPIATYEVIDGEDRAEREHASIREDDAHIKIHLDLGQI